MLTHPACRAARHRTSGLRGLTLPELMIVLVVLVVIVAILLPVFDRSRPHGSRQLKDSTQVRGIVQGMIVWASNNPSGYPLPSAIDPLNFTVGEPDEAKNTTANILSVLIMNGNISPEICVSPAESNNDHIQVMSNYEYSTPSAAVLPANALWDPSFRGTPEDPIRFWGEQVPGTRDARPGNQSYAHLLPFGNRRKQWSDTYNSTDAIFGNRGPTYANDDAAPSRGKWALLDGPLGTRSNTLLIHGGRFTWEGNIGYNDNHVNFETKGTPDQLTFFALGDKAAPDNLFVNETDEVDGDGNSGRVDNGRNAYLRPIAEVSAWARPRVWRD
jgi:prepilin-type N-terminal cleavage/methylation domain-containing protein